jgi:hypothetical protein
LKSTVGEGLVYNKFLISNESIELFGKKTTKTAPKHLPLKRERGD